MLSIVCFVVVLFGIARPLRWARSPSFLIMSSGSTSSSTSDVKQRLLQLCKKTKRGKAESEEEKSTIATLFAEMERRNLRNDTLSDPNINAVWSLEYTTSNALLRRGSKVKTVGPILQTIDVRDKDDLRSENAEVRSYPLGLLGVNLPVKVKARLTPTTPSRVAVAFEFFSIGPVWFPFPRGDMFTSWLDITYLDRDLRLARGAKGNIFVLSWYKEL